MKIDINKVVDKFLVWPLPDSVCADLCATKQGYPHRFGTSLLSASEAKQMFEHVLAEYLIESPEEMMREDLRNELDTAYKAIAAHAAEQRAEIARLQKDNLPAGYSLVETGTYNALREAMVATADENAKYRADLDRVMGEAVKFARLIAENPWSRLDATEAIAFLASPEVQAYRKRQKESSNG